MTFTVTRPHPIHSANPSRGNRPSRRSLFLISCFTSLALSVVALIAPMPVKADSVSPITRIEEDWQIDVGTPSPNENAPEITTVISPRGTLDHEYAVLELNNATQPDFEPGGLQLQAWYDNYHIYSSHHLNNTPLSIQSETIAYTMSMSLYDSWLKFEVKNGSSQSWGPFGTGLGGNLKLWWYTNLSDLSQYSPQTSIDNSRVGWANQRVNKLQLKAVRYYSGDTLIRTDDTPKVVWEHKSGE